LENSAKSSESSSSVVRVVVLRKKKGRKESKSLSFFPFNSLFKNAPPLFRVSLLCPVPARDSLVEDERFIFEKKKIRRASTKTQTREREREKFSSSRGGFEKPKLKKKGRRSTRTTRASFDRFLSPFIEFAEEARGKRTFLFFFVLAARYKRCPRRCRRRERTPPRRDHRNRDRVRRHHHHRNNKEVELRRVAVDNNNRIIRSSSSSNNNSNDLRKMGSINSISSISTEGVLEADRTTWVEDEALVTLTQIL